MKRFLHIFILASFLFTTTASATKAQVDWPYLGWQYRKLIIINNSTNKTKPDYPVKIILTSSNFDFSKANANGDDIRFSGPDGNILSFWKRKYHADQQSAVFNVKLNQLNPGNNKLYIYYGNPQASSVTDGKETFDYFEDYNSFNPTVKFGIFTDIHHDGDDYNYWIAPDFGKAALTDATARMNKITSDMNAWNADFLISLGDLITSQDYSPNGSPGNILPNGSEPTVDTPQQARSDLEDIESIYHQFNGPRYYVHSNHEFYNLSETEIITGPNPILGGQGAIGNTAGAKQSYFSFNADGVHFVLLDLQYDPDNSSRHRGPENAAGYGEGFMPQWQLNWLDQDLSSTTKPTIVFSPSHLEPNDFLENDPTKGLQCNNYHDYNYCTNPTCVNPPFETTENPSCINQCHIFGYYRRVRNAADIRQILEKHKSKVLAVFQGHDHASSNYIHNGIHYRTVDAAESLNTSEVSYLKVKVDPTNQLMAIEGLGKNNTFLIDYQNGQMVLDNQVEDYFLPAPIPYSKVWSNDVMVEADWELNPTNPSQQINLGFFKDGDRINIRHRCANSPSRKRRFNLIGVRRVFAGSGTHNYIGTQVTNEGVTTTTLEKANTATSGHFWSLFSNNIFRFWFNTSNSGGELNSIASQLNNKTPSVWTFDNTTGVQQAKIDNLIIRTTVYPEPIIVSISSEEIAPSPTPLPVTLGDLDGDGDVDIFDYNILVGNFGWAGTPGSIPADIDKDGDVDIFDYNTLVGNFGKLPN